MRSRALAIALAAGLLGSLGVLAVDARSGSRTSATAAPHPVPTAAATADIRIESTINGLTFEDGGGSVPPDVQIGVGPTAVVEFANVVGRVWSRAGAPITDLDLSKLFDTGSDDTADPRILYDTLSGHWFGSLMNITRSRVEIAVSATDDPTGAWTNYTIPGTSGHCPDQPKLGVGNKAVVITADFFDNPCSSDDDGVPAAKIWVLDKADLLAGDPLSMQTFGPYDQYTGIIGAQDLTSSDTIYVAAIDWENAPGKLHVFSVNGAPTAGMTLPGRDITIHPVSAHPRGNQPGPIDLEAAVGKIDDGAFQNGVLSLAMDDTCTPAGDSAKRSCARVERISTTSWSVLTEATFGHKGQDLSYPALRPDTAGNLSMVFGYSSESTFPSLGVTTLTADGTWSDSVLVLGTGTSSVDDAGDATGPGMARYGDYFGAAVDPNDPDLIWVAGEIGKQTANGDWATVIGSVRFSGGPPLTLSTSATAIVWGTGVTLSVRLAASAAASPAARPVHLQSSVNHTDWATIADLTTGATGTATFVYRPVTNLYYRAVFDGAADIEATTSAEKRVTVRQILVLRPDNAGKVRIISAGTKVTFTALVRPARVDVPPGTVTFQLWEYTGSWELVSTKTVKPDASGRAALAIAFPDNASYYVRAIANPTPVNANSAWSPLEFYDAYN